jgi:flagellar biosynthesis/type III secretory pathway protein FliH
MNIRIIGNDIEIDGEKVARVFDVRATLRGQLEEAIDKAERYERMVDHKQSESEDAYEKGFEQGKELGLEEGRQEGYEQREAEEQASG